MHMADALVSPTVGGVMLAVSAGAAAYSVYQIRKQDDFGEKKIPLMAVTGAFVFAAQMINFTIPGTGSSGHIGGGILLSAILGGPAAMLTMAAVLTIQCLFFADGGLLALGCNIFNMGVIPCLIIYPLLFKPLLKKMSYGRITGDSVLSVVLGLELGAFCVVLQTEASGITALPFSTFLLLMLPIHLAIGLVEGIVTGAVLSYVYSARPEILEAAENRSKIGAGVSVKKIVTVLAIAAVLVGGGLSLFASSNPDGLEWSIANVTGSEELESDGSVQASAAQIQDSTAFLPDYGFADADESSAAGGTATAGIVGVVCTFALAGGVAWIISRTKKKKRAALHSQL